MTWLTNDWLMIMADWWPGMFTVANLERAEPHEVWFPQLRTHEHPVLWWLILFERTSWHWHSENQRNHKDTPHQFVSVFYLSLVSSCFSYPPVTILFPVSCFLLTYPHVRGLLGVFNPWGYTQIIQVMEAFPGGSRVSKAQPAKHGT